MEQTIYDAIVIGGGPAGLTAALYLARANNRVLVIEKETFGGQITITSDVVNYPGILKTSGKELTESMRQQAQDFGADFVLAEVQKIEDDGDFKQVKTTRGTFKCFGIVIATGAHPRKAGFIGEEEFKGHGIAYCATCDGSFFEGKEIFVVGGGYAAAEESVFLTRYAKHVTILIREDDFSCASSIASLAKNHEKITVYTNVEVLEVSGHTYLESLKYHNKKTNDRIDVFSLLSYTNINVLPFTDDIPLEVITFLDPTIEKLCFEKIEDKALIHLKFKGEEELILNNAVELEQYLSSGTIKGIITFSMVKEVLTSGGYLLIDELENHFNKEIVVTLMRFFMDSSLNKNGSTLIFTTHYPELLDEYDRNDAIYIVRNRNGITAENLSYILKRNDIKKSDAYQSGFLEGTTPAYEAYLRLKKNLAASLK